VDPLLGKDQAAAPIAAGRVLLARGLITQDQLAEAMVAQADWGSSLGAVLIGKGMVSARAFYSALAEHHQLPFVDLRAVRVDAELVQEGERKDYVRLGAIPWQRDAAGRVTIAATEITPELHAWASSRFGRGGYGFAITSPFDILWEAQRLFDRLDDEEARELLYRRRPEHSAKFVLIPRQVVMAWSLATVLIGAFWLAPVETTVALSFLVSMIYLSTFVLKFALTWIGGNRRIDVKVTDREVRAIRDEDLPVYTVLVPMYKEPEVLPILVAALRALDYPKSKLDVKLVLEAGDHETIDAAKALGCESFVEIIRVPASKPQTKPKACNYALRYARGEFVTIFDAEDKPEPDQLKKVVAAFRKSSPATVCIQARLNYYNARENFLTRMFTLEYSQWFDFLLPGLDALRIPIPLGGTSNHFRTDRLRDLGAWDPYNVTEDADLGVRMTQEGYRVGVVNSTTFEEANTHYGNWIRQRSRWIKGYMQTWLVHMRDPIGLYRSLGPVGFWGFQLFIGSPPLTVLINPLLWVVFAMWLWLEPQAISAAFPPAVLYMALFNLLIANLMYVYFGIVAAFKRGYYDLVPYGLLQPVYWILHSIAAYKALWQLIATPHYWEKTQHGLSQVTQAERAKALGQQAA